MAAQPNEQEDIPILTAPRMQRTPSEEELALAIAMSMGDVEDDVLPYAKVGEIQGEVGKSEGADSIPGFETGGETLEEGDSESSLADKIVSTVKPSSSYPTLDELGLEVKHVLNDGNCEFEAIRDQLRQLGYAIDDHSVLRMMFGDTIQQMKENPDPHWKDVLDSLDAKDLTEIFFEGRWANDVADLFPQVAANMFRCAIHIYSEDGVFSREVRPEGIEGDIEDIARVIYNGYHYDSTRLKGSGNKIGLICQCGKCADKILAFRQMIVNNDDIDDPDSRRNQFTSAVDVVKHLQKLRGVKFVEVMEDMQITDRAKNEVVDVHAGTILQVLRHRDKSMLVDCDEWDRPQTIGMSCYYKLDPYVSEAEKESENATAIALLNLLMQNAYKSRGEQPHDFEVGDRLRAIKDIPCRRFIIYKHDVWKVAKITDDTVTLTNGVDPKIELPSNHQAFRYLKKIVNLDDVESATHAKAYIVQKQFRDIPEGTRLIVDSVISGKTTVYHKTLLEDPVVLTKEELAKCKLESDLIEFEAEYALRGRAGKIVTYFENTQMYRVQYTDGTSSDYSHDELVNEIAYSKKMDLADEEDELEDKSPFMVPNSKRNIVSSMKQLQIQGKWCNEDGSDVFGFVQGSKYFPEGGSGAGFLSINQDDVVTLQLGEETRCGMHANYAIFWENGEVWYHETNIQQVQEPDDRILADQIADSNERLIKRDILQRTNSLLQEVRQKKMIQKVGAWYSGAGEGFREEKYKQMAESSEQYINAQFAKKPGFNYSSRGNLLLVTDLVLEFLYGYDSPFIQFAFTSKAWIYLTMTATLLGWPFVQMIVRDEDTVRQGQLYLLPDEELEDWRNLLKDEVKKYNDASRANKNSLQNLQNLFRMGGF